MHQLSDRHVNLTVKFSSFFRKKARILLRLRSLRDNWILRPISNNSKLNSLRSITSFARMKRVFKKRRLSSQRSRKSVKSSDKTFSK